VSATLLERWRAALPEGTAREQADAVGADLLARWSEPQRHYHTVAHLEFMLSIVDEYADAADDADAVRLATWFHDAVYDPTAVDNEMRSAELAATVLPTLGVPPKRVAEVVRLVWLTTRHEVDDDDANGALLCDADLAILATGPERYDAYRQSIRAEYAHVPDDAFRSGRMGVLGQLLDLDVLYHSPALHEAWDGRARANMLAECRLLTTAAGEVGHGKL
jgi:predicted metal-dependent HD superfamily phosphohydrolase